MSSLDQPRPSFARAAAIVTVATAYVGAVVVLGMFSFDLRCPSRRLLTVGATVTFAGMATLATAIGKRSHRRSLTAAAAVLLVTGAGFLVVSALAVQMCGSSD
jgi:hypothetical protein